MKTFQFMPGKSAKHRTQFEWLPIHDMKLEDVWNTITESGQKRHYAYDLGMTRLSCCFCIMGSTADLKIAAKHNPELAQRYIDKEEELNFTMSMSKIPLKQIINS